MYENEEKELMGTYKSKKNDGNSILVYGMNSTIIDGEYEIYITIKYKNEELNVLLQEKNYKKGECPYNVEYIKKVPYFVVDNEVYYLDDIFEVGFNEDD